MDKPCKKTEIFTYYDYDEVIRYLEKKYAFSSRDYKKKFSENMENEYCDFWHWLLDNDFVDMSNPSMQSLYVTKHLEKKDNPDWVKKILQYFYDEFGEDEMGFKVSW